MPWTDNCLLRTKTTSFFGNRVKCQLLYTQRKKELFFRSFHIVDFFCCPTIFLKDSSTKNHKLSETIKSVARHPTFVAFQVLGAFTMHFMAWVYGKPKQVARKAKQIFLSGFVCVHFLYFVFSILSRSLWMCACAIKYKKHSE